MMRTAVTLIVGAGLWGCSLFSVHKYDVQQGNALEPETVAKLEAGMTPKQIRFLLGNPLITDSYHPERWDYVFSLRDSEGEHTQRRLTVYFEDGVVSRIE